MRQAFSTAHVRNQSRFAGRSARPAGGAGLLTIDANEASRVFSINDGVQATITGLTVTGGGNVASGGGVHNLGDLTLDSVVVSGNHTILTGKEKVSGTNGT